MATPDVPLGGHDDDEDVPVARPAAGRRGPTVPLPDPEVLTQLLEGIGAATKPSTSLLSDGARQRAQALLVAGEALRGAPGHTVSGLRALADYVMGSPPPAPVGVPHRVPRDSHQA